MGPEKPPREESFRAAAASSRSPAVTPVSAPVRALAHAPARSLPRAPSMTSLTKPMLARNPHLPLAYSKVASRPRAPHGHVGSATASPAVPPAGAPAPSDESAPSTSQVARLHLPKPRSAQLVHGPGACVLVRWRLRGKPAVLAWAGRIAPSGTTIKYEWCKHDGCLPLENETSAAMTREGDWPPHSSIEVLKCIALTDKAYTQGLLAAYRGYEAKLQTAARLRLEKQEQDAFAKLKEAARRAELKEARKTRMRPGPRFLSPLFLSPLHCLLSCLEMKFPTRQRAPQRG